MATRNYINGSPQTTTTGALTNSSTSITVNSLTGYPSAPFYAVLGLGTGSAEVVLVSSVAGTTLTVSRGQDGTIAVTHPSGETFDHAIVAQDHREANTHVNSTTGVHGVAGAVVGTTDTQTLTNKTLVSPNLSSPSVSGTSSGVNETLSGTLNVSGATTLAALTANSLTIPSGGAITGTTSAATLKSVTANLIPASFTNEAAATSAGANVTGAIVYLTAPTTSGYSAGQYRWGGSWIPVDSRKDANATQVLTFTPGANTDTPSAGSATWVTLGNVTVPAWATSCAVSLTMNGIYDTGTTNSVTVQVKIGTAGGTLNKRILAPGVAAQRFHQPFNDVVSAPASGSQSVTLFATFTSGTVVRADASSFFTALFHFLP